MKKIVLVAAIIGCVVMTGCSTNSPESLNSPNSSATSEAATADSTDLSVSEKTQKLLDTVEFPSMVEVPSDKLDFYYGITEDMVEEFSAYICGSGAAPDEFGIFVAKDEETAEKIKAALQTRIDDQHDTFESYTPDAMYRFDDCFNVVNGKTVIYAICSDNTIAKEILA